MPLVQSSSAVQTKRKTVRKVPTEKVSMASTFEKHVAVNPKKKMSDVKRTKSANY